MLNKFVAEPYIFMLIRYLLRVTEAVLSCNVLKLLLNDAFSAAQRMLGRKWTRGTHSMPPSRKMSLCECTFTTLMCICTHLWVSLKVNHQIYFYVRAIEESEPFIRKKKPHKHCKHLLDPTL
jgi:hypothetical protein